MKQHVVRVINVALLCFVLFQSYDVTGYSLNSHHGSSFLLLRQHSRTRRRSRAPCSIQNLRPFASRLSGVVNHQHNGSSMGFAADSDTTATSPNPLHIVVIDAIQQILLMRARSLPPYEKSVESEPLEIALAAGRIASETIAKFRTEQSQFSAPEEQTMAGRIVGIVMRLDILEEQVLEKLQSTSDDDSSEQNGFLPKAQDGTYSDQRIEEDANFRKRRAETIVALFLDTIERPGLKQSGQSVPGGSEVDFLDPVREQQLLKETDLPIESKSTTEKSKIGDRLREATGIRPSLHPMTINAIAEGLKLRAERKPLSPLRVVDGVEDYEITLTAGRIAENALLKRKKTSTNDSMQLTPEEEQVVAGRIVAVLTRLDYLEELLYSKCCEHVWIEKYNEWSAFGVIKNETGKMMDEIDAKVLDDPLFTMNRAEALLALFLHMIEGPGFEQKGHVAPGGSTPDFIDSERKAVLLS